MYENGKAIGGEGHPTNADEITFNNEDTDLVSRKVGSAIKEVNAKFDRGSVKITADGVKTYVTLLNELFALLDLDKVSPASIIRIGSSMHNLSIATSADLDYGGVYVLSDGSYTVIGSVYLSATASKFIRVNVNTSNGAIIISNNTISVPPINTEIEVYY